MKEEIKKRLSAFFDSYPIKKYKKGQVLFEAGQSFDSVYWVKSGYLWAYDLNKEDKEIGIQVFQPLYYFPLIALKTGGKCQHRIESLTPVEILVAPKADFEKFLAKNPRIDEAINLSIMEKFTDLTAYMSQLVGGDAYAKVAGLIYNLAKEFGVSRSGKVNTKFKITHKFIASLTGLTRETVTLQMLKLEKNKVIDNERRQVTILDNKELKRILGY